ncbi:hypothetical protein BWI75_20160 [Gloeocapsopsis sp. AAB1 = 1H9]|uniref:Uncharacterized protein n=2 Tax=Gloeocapsopsis TaxID=693222 RepID=A0A6N8G100_9CHRO|nr:hypothetical protein [Gloeocapsopsis dulcis AAB1 = 1H9]
MRQQRLIGLMLVGMVWAIAIPPVAAQEEIPSKTLAELIAAETRKLKTVDIAQNVPTQVTGVRVFDTGTGLEIILDAGQLSQPATSVVGNTLNCRYSKRSTEFTASVPTSKSN